MVEVVPSNSVVIRGPFNARWLYHAQILPNGQQLLYWKVGDQNSSERTDYTTVEFFRGHSRFPMTETEPLILLSWERLMTKVKVIMDGSESGVVADAQRAEAKYQARGIAEVLAIQMKPFMESADHVVKCAVK